MGEENQKAEVRSFIAPITIAIVVAVFVLAYIGAAWFPEAVHSVFQVKEGTDPAKKFDVFGPIGDFFGGIINPILTFITICLLLQSIKIQRSELKATRDEMKAATKQASITADAARKSLMVSRVAERPYILAESVKFDANTFNDDDGSTDVEYYFEVDFKNYGRGFAVVDCVFLDVNIANIVTYNNEGQNCALPIKAESDFSIKIRIPNDIVEGNWDGFEHLEEHGIDGIHCDFSIKIIYRDPFYQKWSTSVKLKKRDEENDYFKDSQSILDELVDNQFEIGLKFLHNMENGAAGQD